MKNKIILSALLIFTMISCFGQRKSNQTNTANPIQKTLLIGIWTDGRTDNATFEIDKKTIFYVENQQGYNYKIVGNSIVIKFDGFDNASKIEKVTKDSLVLIQNNERLVFWRFKN